VFEICVPGEQQNVEYAPREPVELVSRLAYQKAADVARRFSEGLVLGCDTVAVCNGQVLASPSTRKTRDGCWKPQRSRAPRAQRAVPVAVAWRSASPARGRYDPSDGCSHAQQSTTTSPVACGRQGCAFGFKTASIGSMSLLGANRTSWATDGTTGRDVADSLICDRKVSGTNGT